VSTQHGTPGMYPLRSGIEPLPLPSLGITAPDWQI